MKTTPVLAILLMSAFSGYAQDQTPPAQSAFQPKPIAPGGIILPLYPPNSPLLKQDRLHGEEKYNSAGGGGGSIKNVINIHNPSIEVHLVADPSLNGAAVILAPGGGHKILWVGPEGAD